MKPMKFMNEFSLKRGGRRGFTLVELLVVLVIVATLASVGFAVMTSVIVKAKGVAGESGARALETALKHYSAEYGTFPREWKMDTEGLEANAEVMDILLGINDQANPRKLRFIDGKAASESGNGVGIVFDQGEHDSSGTYVDPFGGAYHLLVDADEDGQVPNPDPTSKRKTVWQSVIVYSAGPDGDLETWDDNIRSWK